MSEKVKGLRVSIQHVDYIKASSRTDELTVEKNKLFIFSRHQALRIDPDSNGKVLAVQSNDGVLTERRPDLETSNCQYEFRNPNKKSKNVIVTVFLREPEKKPGL